MGRDLLRELCQLWANTHSNLCWAEWKQAYGLTSSLILERLQTDMRLKRPGWQDRNRFKTRGAAQNRSCDAALQFVAYHPSAKKWSKQTQHCTEKQPAMAPSENHSALFQERGNFERFVPLTGEALRRWGDAERAPLLVPGVPWATAAPREQRPRLVRGGRRQRCRWQRLSGALHLAEPSAGAPRASAGRAGTSLSLSLSLWQFSLYLICQN